MEAFCILAQKQSINKQLQTLNTKNYFHLYVISEYFFNHKAKSIIQKVVSNEPTNFHAKFSLCTELDKSLLPLAYIREGF